MELKNFCGHVINLNSGKAFPVQGNARVDQSFGQPDEDSIMDTVFGEIIGLPAPVDGVRYIVSALVLSAAKAAGRTDCIAPATGHPDAVRSADRTKVISVPGFIR